MALFPVRTNPRWRPPPSWIISNGHISQQLTIYLYSAHRAVNFAIAQLSCYMSKLQWRFNTSDLNNCQNRLSMSESTHTSQCSGSLHLLGKAYCRSKHTIVGWGHYQVCRVLYQLLGQTDVYGMPIIYKLRDFAQPFRARSSPTRNDQCF